MIPYPKKTNIVLQPPHLEIMDWLVYVIKFCVLKVEFSVADVY